MPRSIAIQTEEVEKKDALQQTDTVETCSKHTQVDVPQRNSGDACAVSASFLMGDDSKTKFYTGLSTWELFLHVFSLLSASITRSRTKLTLEDELVVTLMKLRLNSPFQDFAYRWGISISTVTRIFNKWIDVMNKKMKFLIMWPFKDILRQNMPQVFKDTFPDTVCIIDCSEVYIERPTNYLAHA